ncbi:glutathione S-transferase family protein [Marinivivus vitaminiproducens]|uniref:glutathione S-transferase family protein n=1 Tax=Marinivivus vitaminiproducens TaxID=3035935 RepID=UPI0027985ADA|nr:glutathione S-transferase [Geminicoccaceae bacterium SCSIO 64248]
MITVHHLNNSRSHRVLWLLEELMLEYRVVTYTRDPATLAAPAELQRIHPLGKAPVIEDEGMVLAESGAILEYIVGRHGGGRLAPAAGTPEHVRYLSWLHFAEGSAMPPLLLKIYASRLGDAARPIMGRIDGQIARMLDHVEEELDDTPWFSGESFGAADIQMSFPLEAAQARGAVGENRPRIERFLQRIHRRPAFLRAIERGGPYELMR